jgi:hypothetical protein
MTLLHLAFASLRYYRRSVIAVVLGVASAVAVLSGSFLVGSSVRRSLAALTLNRIGQTGVVIGAEQPFTEPLAERLSACTTGVTSAVRRRSAIRSGPRAAAP